MSGKHTCGLTHSRPDSPLSTRRVRVLSICVVVASDHRENDQSQKQRAEARLASGLGLETTTLTAPDQE
jgi:hypothetical protein